MTKDVEPPISSIFPHGTDEHVFLRGGYDIFKTDPHSLVGEEYAILAQLYKSRTGQLITQYGRPIFELTNVLGPIGKSCRIHSKEIVRQHLPVELGVTSSQRFPDLPLEFKDFFARRLHRMWNRY